MALVIQLYYCVYIFCSCHVTMFSFTQSFCQLETNCTFKTNMLICNSQRLCICQEARCITSRLSIHEVQSFFFFYLLALHHHNHPHSHKHLHRAENTYFPFPSGRFSAFELHTLTNWPTAWCRIYPQRDSSERERGAWLGTITMGADLMMCWTSKKSLNKLRNSLPCKQLVF